ncbi:MAG: hypothetical protein VKM98_04105 [Cyanobacteriota bacterium]|nr:hypothetical protein [Cyanobacteriota bacterium]
MNGPSHGGEATSPLSPAEMHQLEATLLPALERHHLRLLAHALRTLQLVQRSTGCPGVPAQPAIAQWLLQQPSLVGETQFCEHLASQLSSAALQLEQLGRQRGRPALALGLDELIGWAKQQADQRLANGPPEPPPTPPGPQPPAR